MASLFFRFSTTYSALKCHCCIFSAEYCTEVREAGKITGQNIENHPTNETQFFALSQRRVAGDVRLKLILLNVTSEPSLLKTNTF